MGISGGRLTTVLGIDLGTSSAKALVADIHGAVVSVAAEAYPVVAEETGWAESDPGAWWAAVGRAVRTAVADARSTPVAVGLSGQMHGVVVTGAGGEALRPALLWADGRAWPYLDRYRELGPAGHHRLGNPLTPGMAGPLLLWVADHEPDLYSGARWALQPKDWLRLQMTGEALSEPSDASATLLYDVGADSWDTATIDALGLRPELFAPLLASSGQPAGELTRAAADHLGLPAGLPVAAGAADTAAAMMGCGLAGEGLFQLTIGTGAQLVTPSSQAEDLAGRGVHLYRTATEGGWYRMAATLNAGLALDWVRQVLNATWSELYAAAAPRPRPGDPIFLPHLAGERTPFLDPTMRGAWTGLGIGHDRVALLRSALEGVAFAVRDAFDVLPGSDAAGHLRLAGGGSRSDGWRQMLANALGVALHAVDVADASGRGAALTGALATGLVTREDVYGPLAPAARPVAEPEPAAADGFSARWLDFRRIEACLRPAT